jgi:CRP-like cAMP-binding protein
MTYFEFYKRNEELLRPNSKEIVAKPKEEVLVQGEMAKKVLLLIEGKVKVVHRSSRGDEFIIGYFENEEFFGHLEYNTGDKLVATVQCVSECRFIELTGEAYIQWFKKDLDFALYVHKGLSNSILNDSRRIVENNFFPLEYHILKFIIESSEDFAIRKFQFSRSELAAFTGVQLRSVNRILKSLVDEKYIDIDKDMLTVRNKRAIEKRFMQNL